MALTVNGGSTIYGLLANFNRIETERAVTMARLSTGKRINRAADDPAGMIALNSLESELGSVNAALSNNQRSRAMLDTADGALSEVSALLREIEGLAVASAGNTLSDAEIAANQAQIDSAIESIDRIVGSTTFNGRKLLDGTHEITTTMSPADAADLKDIRVHGRPSGDDSTTLTVKVVTAAGRASTSGTEVADVSSPLSAATSLSISGKEGTALITLASGSNIAAVVSQINASKGETGVSATASGTQLTLTSVDYGSDAFISVKALSGDDDVMATADVDTVNGTDAVVTVNGAVAAVDGTEIYYNGSGVSLSATLVDNTVGTRTITVTGGGATFQIGTNLNSKAVLGLGGLFSSSLGRADLGYVSDLKSSGSASLTADPGAAALIARKATLQVATTAARLGGFISYQLDSTTNSLSVLKENLASAASAIGDTDFALETSRLQRQNLLANASLSLMDLFATQQQSVLNLLI